MIPPALFSRLPPGFHAFSTFEALFFQASLPPFLTICPRLRPRRLRVVAASTMSNVDIPSDGLVGLDYDSRGYLQPPAWPVAVDQNGQRTDGRRDISPLQTSGHAFEQAVTHDPNLMADWQFQQLQPHLQYHDEISAPQFTSSYALPLQASPVDLLPATQAPLDTGLLDGPYLPLSAPVDMAPFSYQDLHADLMAFPDGLPDMSSYAAPQSMPDSSSPTDTYLEVRSLTSSSSDNGWSAIENRRSIDFSFPEQGIFINPTQTLHDRTLSESSFSDLDLPRNSFGSFVDISNPLNSPSSESNLESVYNNSVTRRISCDDDSHGSQSPTSVSPVAIVRPVPVPIKKSSSPTRSSPTSQASSTSPPTRKPSRKSPIAAKTSETKVRKQSQTGKPETEKRVGKRKGPLKPDQRKQASEIRKLRACLRCKFLKKTVR